MIAMTALQVPNPSPVKRRAHTPQQPLEDDGFLQAPLFPPAHPTQTPVLAVQHWRWLRDLTDTFFAVTSPLAPAVLPILHCYA